MCEHILKVNFTKESPGKTIRLGKIYEDKDRPLLITLKQEDKMREIFKNLNKLREAGSPLENVIITHDLTKKQKGGIDEARDKENKDDSSEYMYHVRGPPWSWRIK